MDGGELHSMVMRGARRLSVVVLDESKVMRQQCRSNGEGGGHKAVAYGYDKELAAEQGIVVGAGLKSLKI